MKILLALLKKKKKIEKNGNDIFDWIMYYSVIKLLTFSMPVLKLGQFLIFSDKGGGGGQRFLILMTKSE